MNYINNLSNDATIIVNQNGKDWLASVSQIANLNSQDIFKSISTVKTDLQLEIKDTLLGYVSHQQLDETVQDIKSKTDEQITVTLWHYCKKSEIDEIIELDYLVNYYTKDEISILFSSLQNNVSNSLLNVYTKDEVNNLISNILTNVNNIKNEYSSLAVLIGKISESVEKTILSKYYTKNEIDEKYSELNTVSDNKFRDYVTNTLTPTHVVIKKVNDGDDPFRDGYATRYEHNLGIQEVKSYTDTQIASTAKHYIKRIDVKNQIDNVKNSLTSIFNTKFTNYYTKQEINKKFEDIGKAYVQILTPREYQTLKLYGQIKDNNLYLISKYGRPIELYIGKFLFAKRSDDTAIGFPYTFPLVF